MRILAELMTHKAVTIYILLARERAFASRFKPRQYTPARAQRRRRNKTLAFQGRRWGAALFLDGGGAFAAIADEYAADIFSPRHIGLRRVRRSFGHDAALIVAARAISIAIFMPLMMIV